RTVRGIPEHLLVRLLWAQNGQPFLAGAIGHIRVGLTVQGVRQLRRPLGDLVVEHLPDLLPEQSLHETSPPFGVRNRRTCGGSRPSPPPAPGGRRGSTACAAPRPSA